MIVFHTNTIYWVLGIAFLVMVFAYHFLDRHSDIYTAICWKCAKPGKEEEMVRMKASDDTFACKECHKIVQLYMTKNQYGKEEL